MSEYADHQKRSKHPAKAHAHHAAPKSASAAHVQPSPQAEPSKSPVRSGFLDGVQRARLENKFVGRVVAAQIAYVSALGDLRVDKLVEKEEELPLFVSLLIAAGGIAMESTIKGAVMLLKRGGEAVGQLAEAGIADVESSAVDGKILGLSEKSVEGLIAMTTDKTKEKFKGIAGGAVGEEKVQAKSAELSYIDYLRDKSLVIFQHIREDQLAVATDAQLLALFTAFDGAQQTLTMYRSQLEKQIKLYMGSHAKEIGHRNETKTEAGRQYFMREEMRVAKVRTGGGERYAYVLREFNRTWAEPGDAYEDSENALSFQEGGEWTLPRGWNGADNNERTVHRSEPAEPDVFMGYVEPELLEAALATHEKRWLQQPETFRFDYSTSPPSLTKVAP